LEHLHSRPQTASDKSAESVVRATPHHGVALVGFPSQPRPLNMALKLCFIKVNILFMILKMLRHFYMEKILKWPTKNIPQTLARHQERAKT
jgi:hypothetical protein